MKKTFAILSWVSVFCSGMLSGSASAQIPAPVPQTGQLISYCAGDDGNLRFGREWPAPRFTDRGDGTVLDNLTGLLWIQNPQSLPGNTVRQSWTNALLFCNSLDYAGRTDWRLPNREEILSLIDYSARSPALPGGHPFVNTQVIMYWSSTSYAAQTGLAWQVNMNYGYVSAYDKTGIFYVWPVSTVSSGACPVARTGQSAGFFPSDDGALQYGAEVPSPRFTDNDDGTVSDQLTGLMWVKSPGGLPGNSGLMNWSSAVSFCNGLSYAGYSDWRLPGIRELKSLVDLGAYNPALPAGHPFGGIISSSYWSGTTYANQTNTAYYVGIKNGHVGFEGRLGSVSVWPVRGGQ